MPPSSFKHFSALPAELRLQVWEAALAVPSVWAALPRPLPSDGLEDGSNTNPEARASAYTMAFVGPVPYMAGLACKEAWDLMNRSYGGPVHGPAGAPRITQPSWVNMDHTVVYLGDPLELMNSIRTFDAAALPRVQHVALTWRMSHMYLLSAACHRLTYACPRLRTLIIQTSEYHGTRENPGPAPPEPLGLERAAFYARLLAYTGPQLNYDGMDMAQFRRDLNYDLANPPPTVHVLGPGELPAIPS
ncbi:hypothetical protein C8A05DRAFT_18216 [Staphylotrichum tortipilum]|uniref:2EXR domain-containing protein n=1 Tax=Staphylotrichum tortipilum TaxID=2831512 RepID=A0AAN6MF24_9PEZI|nr:hypothetical protein C8A05DRAFT_18216 [Staphylotrichum longicolle]